MTEILKNEAHYYPKGSLIPKSAVNGARMWSVSLEKTMFTYFEIDPNSRFDKHSHVNEQITMVLEGELFFEFENRIVCVNNGEVIAIPSNIPHAAFTMESSATAVDAWSPIVEKYLHKENCSLENEIVLAGGIGMKP